MLVCIVDTESAVAVAVALKFGLATLPVTDVLTAVVPLMDGEGGEDMVSARLSTPLSPVPVPVPVAASPSFATVLVCGSCTRVEVAGLGAAS